MRILVIDDSRTVRRLLSSFLKDLSIDSIEACDGQDALEKLDQVSELDGALVDWDMPILNGLEFVKAVRSQPEYDDLKLMMVFEAESLKFDNSPGASRYKPASRGSSFSRILKKGLPLNPDFYRCEIGTRISQLTQSQARA